MLLTQNRLLALCLVMCMLTMALQAPVANAGTTLSQPEYGVILEEDVAIPVRDGTVLRADVYRPDSATAGKTVMRFPVLMSMSAYQKDMDRILPHAAPFTHVERPEPDWWVSRGYVLVFIDSRGTGKSPGKADIWSMQEARDYYDAIEWAAKQNWSSGKVGLAGVSYYAITQWNVASLQPPSLTPVTGGIAHADNDGSVKFSRQFKRLITPWIPIHGVVSML